MTWLLVALAVALVNFVLGEIFNLFPLLAIKVIRAAARRLPPSARRRYEDEWLAELDALTGLRLIKLLWALSVFRGSWALSRQLRSQRRPQKVARRARADSAEERLRYLSLAVQVTSEAVDASAIDFMVDSGENTMIIGEAKSTCS